MVESAKGGVSGTRDLVFKFGALRMTKLLFQVVPSVKYWVLGFMRIPETSISRVIIGEVLGIM